MARPLRIEFPDAFYHVTARGNERRNIFRDDRDRQRLLGYLESAVLRYKAVVHVYCLMSNHYHLLLSTPAGNLSQIMQHINGGYTAYFNKRHNRAGHLLQGRYKAILVEADPYAGELSRYIHLNPVRAGIAGRPEEYPWSSYAAFIGKTVPPNWLTIDWLLRYFGKKTGEARQAYRFFVEANMGEREDPLKEAVAGLILGRVEFVDEIRGKFLGKRQRERDIPSLRELTKASVSRIFEEAAREFQDEPGVARKAAIYLSHQYSGRSLREIGDLLALGESGVTQASRRFESNMKGSRTLRRRVQRVRKTLSL
jgi:putative transposase